MFRFHTGSIKRLSERNSEKRQLRCFDSILVRLKGNRTPAYDIPIGGFDSILVRLKELPTWALQNSAISFDSILVRLKVLDDACEDHFLMFRFHTGSIKRTSESEEHRGRTQTKFRFHTGSIKRSQQTIW